LGSRDVTAGKAAISHPRVWRRLWRDERGVVAIAVAILLPVLIGFAGLGVEVGMWFWIQRQNQSAADAAAISAALEYAAQIENGVTTNPAVATAAATTAANCNLFSTSSSSANAVCPWPSSGSNTITLYSCYGFTVGSSCNTSGSTGTPNAVQVVLTQPLNTTFANLVTAIWGPSLNTVNVTTTAISAFPQTSSACILALDPTAANAVFVDNGTVSNSNCWVASNSSSGSALNCNGCTITGPTTVVGGDAVSNNGHLNGSPNRTYASAIADPYASVLLTQPNCTTMPTGATSIGPGRYCEIPVNGQPLTMLPGVYHIDGQFRIQNGSAVTANEVTIVINGSFYVDAGSTLNITAPSTGSIPVVGVYLAL
jgi:Flp pilus assembly protein TadG